MLDSLDPPESKKPKLSEEELIILKENVDFPGSTENKKSRLSGEEFIKLKESLRERKKRFSIIPRLRLLSAGENASLTVNVDSQDRIPIFLNDVQHLLMYSMLGHHATYVPDRWCKLDKYNKVSHAVVLIVDGLSVRHYLLNESKFCYLKAKSEHSLELITPAAYGGSIVEELAAVPFSGSQKKNLINKYGSLKNAVKVNGDIIKLLKKIFPMKSAPKSEKGDNSNIGLPSTDQFSRTELILSPYQLIEENYPIPLKGGLAKKYVDYVLTKDEYDEVNSKSPMFGIDCEMCRTTIGCLELTRVSIVDEKLDIVYDTLVKPDNKITDYLTQYSGITEMMLENVTTKLSDVQKFIKEFLPANAILVGQSLNSDMHALKMMHPYIIDTSVIFNITGDRYRKTKLKTLVQEFLNENIQKGRSGHCSTEDSQASMKLVLLKLANSIYFGDSILMDQCQTYSYESMYKKDNRNFHQNQKQMTTFGSLIFNHVTKVKTKTAAIFGCTDVLNDYSKIMKNSTLNIMEDKEFGKGDNVRLAVVNSNKEAVSRCSEVAMEHALNFCHVKFSEDQISEENLDKTINSVDKWVKKLWKHTAFNGLICVIFSGQSSSNGACFLSIKKNTDIDLEQV
ncbi:RNA exonuclease 5 [Phymastichus coffea]|uniref:RNA exonuclease 5 n=1 Tax=Phymastichus coffea TaxID=108790 RepID=UPI00273ABDC4|nr:RNA exonuclease 5 [Phymastichus coffea]